MFEAALSSTLPDPQRLQRLTLAAAIALSVTAASIAGVWTLERLHIDRVGGPTATPFELMSFSVLPPPKPVTPPPPPTYGDEPEQASDPAPTSRVARPDQPDHASDQTDPSPRGLAGLGASGSGERGAGIPTGPGCAPGLCGPSLIPGSGTPCIGPSCAKPGPPSVAAAPGRVEFSALRCLACADPDRDLLRKADMGSRKRSGAVGVRFCVDTRGHVEPGSVEISRSFGDATIDDITRAAVRRWRFSPMKVAGQPRRACTQTQFQIHFN